MSGETDLESSTQHRDAIDRRAFLTSSAMAALLLSLPACGDLTGPDVGPSIGHTITVADFPDLTPVGGVVFVSLDGSPLALVRAGDASFLALSRVCPHRGSLVNETAGGFVCPRHGARFDAGGTWVGGQLTTSLRERSTHYDVSTDVLTID